MCPVQSRSKSKGQSRPSENESDKHTSNTAYIIELIASGPIGAKAKAKSKKMQRIVWMPMSQCTPKATSLSLGLL